jgi:hypothetical protein
VSRLVDGASAGSDIENKTTYVEKKTTESAENPEIAEKERVWILDPNSLFFLCALS